MSGFAWNPESKPLACSVKWGGCTTNACAVVKYASVDGKVIAYACKACFHAIPKRALLGSYVFAPGEEGAPKAGG